MGLVVKFIVFWLPTLATMTYHLIWEEATSEFLEYLAFHSVLLNCLGDPTVYVFLSRDVRAAIQLMICNSNDNTDIPPPAIIQRAIGTMETAEL